MKHAGFTVVEVLIAVLIVSISFTALYRMHWLTMAQHRELLNTTLALAIAQQEIETWHGLTDLPAYRQLVSGRETRRPPSSTTDMMLSWNVREYVAPDYKIVDLVISWRRDDDVDRISMSTVIAKPYP